MKTVAIAVALALSGCHRSPPNVWPKSAGNVAVPDWKDDGGQSLEPQGSIATAIEASDDVRVAATESDADKDKAKADKPTTATPNSATTPAVKGEVIFSDEIIIDLPNP